MGTKKQFANVQFSMLNENELKGTFGGKSITLQLYLDKDGKEKLRLIIA